MSLIRPSWSPTHPSPKASRSSHNQLHFPRWPATVVKNWDRYSSFPKLFNILFQFPHFPSIYELWPKLGIKQGQRSTCSCNTGQPNSPVRQQPSKLLLCFSIWPQVKVLKTSICYFIKMHLTSVHRQYIILLRIVLSQISPMTGNSFFELCYI